MDTDHRHPEHYGDGSWADINLDESEVLFYVGAMENDPSYSPSQSAEENDDDVPFYVDDEEGDPSYSPSSSEVENDDDSSSDGDDGDDNDDYDDDMSSNEENDDDADDKKIRKSEKMKSKKSNHMSSDVASLSGDNLKPATRKKICPQDCTYDVTYPDIYTKTYVYKKNQNSKFGRMYDKLHACIFCERLISNIQSHLGRRHRTEDEIKDIRDLKRKIKKADESSKKGLELKKKYLQNLLRNRGDNLHNKKVLAAKEGEILIKRRKRDNAFNVQDYGPCPDCEEWIVLEYITKHQTSCLGIKSRFTNKHQTISQNISDPVETCTSKGQGETPSITETHETSTASMPKGSAIIQSQIMKGKIVGGSSKLKKEVFPYMLSDERTEAAKEDRLIKTLGEVWLMKNIDDINKSQRIKLTGFRMRLSAGILLRVRKETGLDGSMSDFLCPRHFDKVVQCSLQVCKDEEHGKLKNPITAIKLGYDLNRLATAKLGYAIKESNEDEKREARDVLKLLQSEWSSQVSKLTSGSSESKDLKKKNEMPDAEDIRKLALYLVLQLKNIDLENLNQDMFREAVVLTQARLILYNRCLPEELEKLSVEDYHGRPNSNDTSFSLRHSMTMLEELLLNSRGLAEIGVNTDLRVALVIPGEVKVILEMMADKKCRKKAGIQDNNKYMFASTGEAAVSANESLENVKRRPELDLKHPECIHGNNFRRHTATITQALSLDDDEVKWVCNHFGQAEITHREENWSISGITKKIDIAKLMLIQNLGSKFSNRTVSEIQFDELDEAVENNFEVQLENQPKHQPSHSEIISCNLDDDDGTDKKLVSRKSPAGKVIRVRWTKSEEMEIHRHFVKYFNGEIKKKCPSQKDCRKAIAISHKEGGAIYLRKWDVLKKKVSNMLHNAGSELHNTGLKLNNAGSESRKAGSELRNTGTENLGTLKQEPINDVGNATETEPSKIHPGTSDKCCGTISDEDDDGDDEMFFCQKQTKRKVVSWTKFEEEEIHRYFVQYFNGETKRKCPNQQQCLQAILFSRKEGGRIHLRHWETLKKKVANMLIQYQRKSCVL
ncbi:uncharacterized protein LOC117315012 [Pecten maximus]|uniref:uncharacterized protein LOC117315012 n=1 Tax=Pecten maximus TaxID=6579 RepID=UPI0014581B60|nr:uncharacterized protein LOC117315012 [Pecten maximus]